MKISHNEETGKLNCFSGSLCFSLFLSVSLSFSLFLSVSLCFNVRWCTSPYFKCIGPNKFKDFEDKTTICQYWFMIMKHGINPYTNQGASSSSRTFHCTSHSVSPCLPSQFIPCPQADAYHQLFCFSLFHFRLLQTSALL